MNRSTIMGIIIAALPILIAITFHEVAHGFAAYKLGDPTAKMKGRLTLNPLAHIDLFGTIIIPFILFITAGFVIGYAKPVPINPYNFKNPKRDMAISAIAGPATNIVLAVLSIAVIRMVIYPLSSILPQAVVSTVLSPIFQMFRVSVVINVILAIFNMVPIPPLDGGRVAVGFLPHKQAEALSKLEPFGLIIVIVLFFVLDLGRFMFDPIIRFVYALIG
ncbi:peptidase family M50 [bacterium BMS3Abin07]|nr:peptidase family M50 [bacterium BMS3Abin07]GBE31408.1 peptidase family M50 [bacterium BMS3Bbin05]HDL20224.1 site-2 protease family protein [Nitrospirota bacterium]HDO21441.1 site-2 protease family protein [Nitrospirota bacterium]HDZ87040.1 site-2 protease family protein [Nitrospirota bacterium]